MDLRSPALYIGGKYYWVSRSQKFMTSTKIAEMVPISFRETALPCPSERARMTQALGMRLPKCFTACSGKKGHVIYFGQCHWLRGKNAREMLLR